MAPQENALRLQAALAHHRAGRFAEAEALYRQILAADPRSAAALHYLGVMALQSGRADLAIDWMNRATALDPGNAELLSNLGEACRALGRSAEAEKCFRRALELNPDWPAAVNNLGVLLRERGMLGEAQVLLEDAVQRDPKSVTAHLNLAFVLCDAQKIAAALPHFHQAVEINPRMPETWSQYAAALQQVGRLDEAVACCERALTLHPGLASAETNLAHLRFEQGDPHGAVNHLRRALTADPGNAAAHSSFLFIRNYEPGVAAMALLADHERWAKGFAAGAASRRAYRNRREKDRRLRVGYVSPDFRNHALGCNLVPLFREHDRNSIELICYSNVRAPDAWTERFQQRADGWREIVSVSDAQVAAMVEADRVDVLVDLALHSPHNRLGVFALGPAPVQVTFAGYPGTTGLAAIDYRLTDPHLDPPGTDDCYVEQSLRLPHSFWCYEPLVEAFEPGPLPALTNGFVTFGCLNSSCKVNAETLVRWAPILRALPRSRLRLLSAEGKHREAIRATLARHGVAGERVDFVARTARERYFAYYRDIDVGLDALPYNGHTTSLDSYWMGVPVVTLVGATVVGRAGWSQLNNLGLTELAAHREDEFVAIATDLARDLPRLAELRRTLRQRLEASPLMDARGFAHAIEAAYRTMWHRWCETAGR